jgi:outer membrane receptor protein involved in Fe transport
MVNLSYVFPHGTLVYAAAAKGYRPGSGNLPVPVSGPIQCLAGPGNLQSLGLNSAPNAFNPDTLWSYELGEKYMSQDRRLSLDSSFYYEKWQDIQQQVTLNCGFLFTANAGSAGIYGTEMELSAVLLPGLTFVQNVGYTHATLADTVRETGTFAGEQILDVPKVTSSSSLMYSQPVSSDYALTMSVTNQYVGSMQDITFARNTVPGYDLLGARFGVQASGWSAYAFVDNLTNRLAELTNINALSANVPQFNRVAVSRPRTIGIDLQYRY